MTLQKEAIYDTILSPYIYYTILQHRIMNKVSGTAKQTKFLEEKCQKLTQKKKIYGMKLILISTDVFLANETLIWIFQFSAISY